MDERVLVEVYVSAAMLTFDMYIPRNCSVKDLQNVLFPLLTELSEEAFLPQSATRIYLSSRQLLLDEKWRVSDIDICQGDRLIIV